VFGIPIFSYNNYEARSLLPIKTAPIHTYIQYHSRFIPEEVAEVSQIFFRDIYILPKLLATRNTAEVTGGKPIAILSQSISSVSAVNPLIAFYDIHGRDFKMGSKL
jgi:hypothetical protein